VILLALKKWWIGFACLPVICHGFSCEQLGGIALSSVLLPFVDNDRLVATMSCT
jgi:hypothetical protein